MQQIKLPVEISTMENNMPEDITTSPQSFPAPRPLNGDTAVRSGDIWRALWDGVAILVLVGSVDDNLPNRVHGVPVDIGDEEADDSSIILPADVTTFALPVTVWPDLATDFASLIFDRRVGDIRDGFETLDKVTKLGKRGRPILRDTSPRSHAKRIRGLSVDILHDAAQLPSGSGTLQTLLATLPMATIADALEGNRALAVKIKRGTAAVDAAQAAILASLIGTSTQAVLDANPHAPADFSMEVTNPRHSELLRAVASSRTETESEAFTQMTQSVLALAARGEHRDRADWAGRVDTYLAMALASASS
ncbi:hypothetical protein [Frigoribacterium sp. PhB118]|uniref:hypothetical protein n=1 Tax=Frigoribacterium sp. PhB118 TaxID=2485175 RepID=UPI000F4A8613|nr:hypothetical protein [Frigoribacterium sp. PhB118]ROS48782.1 hypothetical protein EDF21_3234 [Frigoribacterium sp. PhB118]